MTFMMSESMAILCATRLMPARFGNFIGEAEESEEESQHGIDAGAYVYEDEDAAAPAEPTGQELMDLDGARSSIRFYLDGADQSQMKGLRMRWSSMRINNTIQRLN